MKCTILAALATITALVAAAPVTKDAAAVAEKRGFFVDYDAETTDGADTTSTKKRTFFVDYDAESADTTGETGATKKRGFFVDYDAETDTSGETATTT